MDTGLQVIYRLKLVTNHFKQFKKYISQIWSSIPCNNEVRNSPIKSETQPNAIALTLTLHRHKRIKEKSEDIWLPKMLQKFGCTCFYYQYITPPKS